MLFIERFIPKNVGKLCIIRREMGFKKNKKEEGGGGIEGVLVIKLFQE